MAFYNRVKVKATTSGLVDFTLGAASGGYRTLAAAGVTDGETVQYLAESANKLEWELGAGAFNAATGALARTTIYNSSNADAKVNFSAAPFVSIVLQKDSLKGGNITNDSSVSGATVKDALQTLDAKTFAASEIGNDSSVAGSTTKDALETLDTDKAPLASPALTGAPTAPTASARNNNTQIATTAYVDGATRERLTANRTYFVDTAGSNSNDGLSSGTPFQTIAQAITVIKTLDLNGFTVTIQLADGTYTAGASFNGPIVGGNVIINGNSTTPANVIISVSSGNAVVNTIPGFNVTVQNFEVRTSTIGWGVLAQSGAKIIVGAGMRFGACASAHMGTATNGTINIQQAYSIVGAASYHYDASLAGVFDIAGSLAITNSGTNAFTAFAHATSGGIINTGAGTYTGGTITGKRYDASLNAIINSSGGGSTYFPGNVSGTTATGGQYN